MGDGFKYINGKKWYYLLKTKKYSENKITNGLFSEHPRDTLRNKLLISWSYQDSSNDKVSRLFTVFKSYVEFGIYQSKIPIHKRCFYELILGEFRQKPHFDIDISLNDVILNDYQNNMDKMMESSDLVINDLVKSIETVLKNVEVRINFDKDVLIFSSHGENKKSYHVVINNYCHSNNTEAKAFYNKVIEEMNPKYTSWIDSAVYSSIQQFRIVGSQKIGSSRIKRFNAKYHCDDLDIIHKFQEEPDSDDHETILMLEESLVSFVSSCSTLPAFENVAEDKVKNYSETIDVTEEEAKIALSLIASAGNITVDNPIFPYKLDAINGPIVILKRTKPSKCKICCRIHHNENPYLLITGDERCVYFCCRRNTNGKKLYLGKLDPKIDLEHSRGKQSEKFGNNNGVNNKSNGMSNNMVNDVRVKWTQDKLRKMENLSKRSIEKRKARIRNRDKKRMIKIYENRARKI